MKKIIILIGLLISNTALAFEITAESGWNHTPSSKRGDGAALILRAEQPIIENNLGLLTVAGEYEYRTSIPFPIGDMTGQSLLAEIFYYPPINISLKPYIFGGVGWSWWNFDRNQDMVNRGIFIDMGNNFIYKVGLGAKYKLNKNWSLNIEWFYDQVDIPRSAHYTNGSFSNVLDTGPTLGHGETDLVCGISYAF